MLCQLERGVTQIQSLRVGHARGQCQGHHPCSSWLGTHSALTELAPAAGMSGRGQSHDIIVSILIPSSLRSSKNFLLWRAPPARILRLPGPQTPQTLLLPSSSSHRMRVLGLQGGILAPNLQVGKLRPGALIGKDRAYSQPALQPVLPPPLQARGDQGEECQRVESWAVGEAKSIVRRSVPLL